MLEIYFGEYNVIRTEGTDGRNNENKIQVVEMFDIEANIIHTEPLSLFDIPRWLQDPGQHWRS